jgi:hypothetical protein
MVIFDVMVVKCLVVLTYLRHGGVYYYRYMGIIIMVNFFWGER